MFLHEKYNYIVALPRLFPSLDEPGRHLILHQISVHAEGSRGANTPSPLAFREARHPAEPRNVERQKLDVGSWREATTVQPQNTSQWRPLYP